MPALKQTDGITEKSPTRAGGRLRQNREISLYHARMERASARWTWFGHLQDLQRVMSRIKRAGHMTAFGCIAGFD